MAYNPHNALLLDMVHVTQEAAIASRPWIGRGDGKAADEAATNAMRSALQALPYDSRIVIGEGERDEAPMLYIGEKLGDAAGLAIDIAVDPLEGTNLCASAAAGALTVLAATARGDMLHAPDVYMEKIAVGGGLPEDIISLERTPAENVRAVAAAKQKKLEEMMVIVLDRPRHASLIHQLREVGVRVQLIMDGDVAAIIQAALPEGGVDMVMGSGGAPEGVLAAAALRCLGGQMHAKLLFESSAQEARAGTMGVHDPHKFYRADELVKGDVIFAATGVTTGALLQGVGAYVTHSLLLDSRNKRMVRLTAQHFIAV
jgi:fructose-1,6-bisphosphatase II / sedoheptulose-1,7-bisphosphatase